MMLADRLKKSVKEIMELSVLEMDLWMAWVKIEQDANKKQMRSLRSGGYKTKNRY
jgi:hypothetical protein